MQAYAFEMFAKDLLSMSSMDLIAESKSEIITLSLSNETMLK